MNKLIGGLALAGILCIVSAVSAWESSGGESASAEDLSAADAASVELSVGSNANCPNFLNGALFLQASSGVGLVSDCFIATFDTQFAASQIGFSSASFNNSIFSISIGDQNFSNITPSQSVITLETMRGTATFSVTSNLSGLSPSVYSGSITLTASGVLIPDTEFGFVASAQEFTATADGLYQFEVWGAQGGLGYNKAGGKGGYSVGSFNLITGDHVYVYTGEQGKTNADNWAGGWNGGGAGTNRERGSGGGGGGTDIRLSVNALYADRVIVAGGGSGGVGYDQGRAGASGGGLIGESGGGALGLTDACSAFTPAVGGSQTAGGSAGNISSVGSPGSFGIGGAGTQLSGSGGSGAGGGWYGGGGGGWRSSCISTGGGGSGYVGGMISGNSIAGNAVMPNPEGGSMTGRAGNGYARISYCGSTCD